MAADEFMGIYDDLDAVTQGPEHKKAALRAAVMVAASGMTPEQLEVFVKITASARVTNEDLVQLARRGIRLHTETYLKDELDRLRRWKAEALTVVDGLQDLGRALGVRLGESITGRTAIDAALALRNERDAARAELAESEREHEKTLNIMEGALDQRDAAREQVRQRDEVIERVRAWAKELVHRAQRREELGWEDGATRDLRTRADEVRAALEGDER